MTGHLTPLPLPIPEVASPETPVTSGGGYATFTKSRVVQLARATPDCQSAVLLLFAWQATLHQKMKRGPLAGLPMASLSGSQLAQMMNRPLRTVRHAIRQLTAKQLIRKTSSPGRKNVYTVLMLDATSQSPRNQQ